MVVIDREHWIHGRVDAGQKAEEQERWSKAWAELEVSECTGALWVVMVMLSAVYCSGHGMQDTARTQRTVHTFSSV